MFWYPSFCYFRCASIPQAYCLLHDPAHDLRKSCMMADSTITAFYPAHTKLGESPLYRKEDNTLHYIDVLGHSIHILKLDASFERRIIRCRAMITCLCFSEIGHYVVCYDRGIASIDKNGAWTVLQEIVGEDRKMQVRLNDGAIDAAGRLWFGEIDLSISPDGRLIVHEEGIVCSNGIGWTRNGRIMLHTDSHAQLVKMVWAYDFDVNTGSISNKRIFIDPRNLVGEPDGLVLDDQDNVYVFLWDGSHVVKYDRTGVLLKTWRLNASRVTHGAWVGEDLDQLVITSAAADDGVPPWTGEQGGSLFWIRNIG
ncbi:SMP-30/Gluconolaconase/LRE-like region-domain-containing protein [Delphinella strobiligena]|nr:SMP-30/Gluconolaconase/LRE-like region-domain-containing protein [Delphinella strobiligena]